MGICFSAGFALSDAPATMTIRLLGRSPQKLRSVCEVRVETVIIVDFGRAKSPGFLRTSLFVFLNSLVWGSVLRDDNDDAT